MEYIRSISLEKSVRYALFLTALTPIMPIFGAGMMLFPYTFGKTLFFRTLVEVALALFLLGLFLKEDALTELRTNIRRILKNPLWIALFAFLFTTALSVFVAVNRFYAIWGGIERGDGLFALAHFVAFALLAFLFFTKEDWITFFKISLCVGGVVLLYFWLQVFRVEIFPFMPEVVGRPGSFLDNAAFLGAYFIFLCALACVVFIKSKKESMWKLSALSLALLSIVSIFSLDVRGALIGLIAGVLGTFLYFAFFRGDRKIHVGEKSVSLRSFSFTVLGALFLLGIIFLATRSAGVWRSVPVLGRIAQIGANDSSFQTRMISLRSSWEAFTERPLLGWGVENFNVAYNKYYDPEYAKYEEAWFDRAHNKIAEVGVTQGAVGLIAYLALFGVLGYTLIRPGNKDESYGRMAPFIFGGLVGYFIQNLFLFDTPVTYFMLFSFVAFSASYEKQRDDQESVRGKAISRAAKTLVSACCVVLVFMIGVAWYLYAFIPVYQTVVYERSIREQTSEKILAAAGAFSRPYNYVQPILRARFLQVLGDSGLLRKQQFSSLTQTAIQLMEDVAEREANYEPRNFIMLAETYNELAKDNPVLFKKSEEYARRALELSPKRQDIYYVLAFSLAGQGRPDDAIQTMRDAVALSPEVAKAHYNLGVELALAGRPHWDEAEEEFARAQDIGFVALLPEDARNMSTIYKEMLYAYIMSHDAARVVRVAERFKKLEPDLAQDMDTIISLAKSGGWAVLIKAVEESSGGN